MLLERDVALAALEDALAQARAGGGRIVLVSARRASARPRSCAHVARASEDRARFLDRYRVELPRRALGDPGNLFRVNQNIAPASRA